MKKPYRLVVFDWEGTLGDALGHVLNTLAQQAQRLQLGTLDEKLARQYVGLGIERATQKLFPNLSIHQQEQLLQAVQNELHTTARGELLFPGARHIVQQIHEAGVDLAIATNRGQQSLYRALHESGLDDFFKVTRAAGQTAPKPCPQMLEEIMTVFDIPPSETLMIGDSLSDIEMCQLAGVDVIGVDFYHQQGPELMAAGAMAVFDDYSQLGHYLELS